MQRSRLKNIVSKANNQTDLFDKFVKQLDKIPENYRLREAWTYYDKPSNVDAAIKNGLIKGLDGETKFASIGYNEKTNEFEYLNTGESGEEVDKDLSVWDNDVVPFVTELKKGGFIREFNKELNCWTYKKGGKSDTKKSIEKERPSYEEWVKDVNPEYLSDNYDLKSAYYTLDPERLERWKFAVNSDNPKYYMDFQNEKGEYPYHLDSIAQYPDSNNFFFLKLGTEDNNPELLYELNDYLSGKNGLRKTHRLVFDKDLNRYFYIEDPNFDFTQLFKQGGQMNVIPEGALHARKNNMEEGGKAFTHKGIPVMSIDGKEQIAEIEKNELVFSKSTTDKIEKYYKEYEKDDSSKKRKEEIALECGKFLVEQILDNTDDRTGLILEVNNG